MLPKGILLIFSRYQSLFAIGLGKSSIRHPVSAELMNVSLCWSASTGVSICSSPHENVAYVFVLSSQSVRSKFHSSFFDSLWDGRKVAQQLLKSYFKTARSSVESNRCNELGKISILFLQRDKWKGKCKWKRFARKKCSMSLQPSRYKTQKNINLWTSEVRYFKFHWHSDPISNPVWSSLRFTLR